MDGCFLWSTGSWDVLAIYPESTSADGSYFDPVVAKIISSHNKKARLFSAPLSSAHHLPPPLAAAGQSLLLPPAASFLLGGSLRLSPGCRMEHIFTPESAVRPGGFHTQRHLPPLHPLAACAGDSSFVVNSRRVPLFLDSSCMAATVGRPRRTGTRSWRPAAWPRRSSRRA